MALINRADKRHLFLLTVAFAVVAAAARAQQLYTGSAGVVGRGSR